MRRSATAQCLPGWSVDRLLQMSAFGRHRVLGWYREAECFRGFESLVWLEPRSIGEHAGGADFRPHVRVELGVSGIGSIPSVSKCSLTFGNCIVVTDSRWNFSMISSDGVFAGMKMPIQNG